MCCLCIQGKLMARDRQGMVGNGHASQDRKGDVRMLMRVGKASRLLEAPFLFPARSGKALQRLLFPRGRCFVCCKMRTGWFTEEPAMG